MHQVEFHDNYARVTTVVARRDNLSPSQLASLARTAAGLHCCIGYEDENVIGNILQARNTKKGIVVILAVDKEVAIKLLNGEYYISYSINGNRWWNDGIMQFGYLAFINNTELKNEA